MHSKYIQNVAAKIKALEGKPQTTQEREALAVELAAAMLQEARLWRSWNEKAQQKQLADMMEDPIGKAFTIQMIDRCFRSSSSSKIADQILYLLAHLGIPQYLSSFKKFQFLAFKSLSPFLAPILVPVMIFFLKKETAAVILPGEAKALKRHMIKRRSEGVRINLNHLGEAILGESEAKDRLDVYLKDLQDAKVECVSIKISTIFSQIQIVDYQNCLEILAERLRTLYRTAQKHLFKRQDGTQVPKFVNLDMEEYRDLQLTKDLFKKVLAEEEFLSFSAGIVLQAYLPDSFPLQQELTVWAQDRLKQGGAPIKIRIVKGANLAMEQFEASVKCWAQAPYTTKEDVDANYKRMLTYGCQKEHAQAVHLGIASHNLFDIAYAILLRAENQIAPFVYFEMLEGMADSLRKVVQKLTGDILLYCPVARKQDFQSAIAYLIRRLDENTGKDNFLRALFGLKVGSPSWAEQVRQFHESRAKTDTVYTGPRRGQNRQQPAPLYDIHTPFVLEADTDFSLEHNRQWLTQLLSESFSQNIPPVPCVIDAEELSSTPYAEGFDPSSPQTPLYQYALASTDQINRAITTAKSEERSWQDTPPQERALILASAAKSLRDHRGKFIASMVRTAGKTVTEADAEISEAIDFAEYYLRSFLHEISSHRDVSWKAKGTVLVASPWNFPISIPSGGIFSALITGNCVLFKPAPEAVYCGFVLVTALWKAGIPKKVLQFINCLDEPTGSTLIRDPRINAVILTGATQTAKLFLRKNPSMHLSAETGGKNALIITATADRDLAIKDLIHSAFGHAGQKCSAASLAILEAEVYDDPIFRKQLKDAAESLKPGTPRNLSSKIPPLIRPAADKLLQGLTSLEGEEFWLAEPVQDKNNPNLWSAGIKFGVKPGSFMHQTELFGPVLAVMRADNLDHAIALANDTPYGLTSGIHSLDPRELEKWRSNIRAGNLYINRTITGAIVGRQPFGGCKESSFGPGIKAGGPNYLIPLATLQQISLPREKISLPLELNPMTELLQDISFSAENLGIFYASVANYAFSLHHFPTTYSIDNPMHVYSDLVIGQDNALYYTKRGKQEGMCLRISQEDTPLDILRSLCAAMLCKADILVSWTKTTSSVHFDERWLKAFSLLEFTEESEKDFLQKVSTGSINRVRLLSAPEESLLQAASISGAFLDKEPVLANGRFELLHYLREVTLSYDYHRYGNLGLREQEERNPLS